MVPADSDKVPRASPYSGYTLECMLFRLRGFHPFSLIFPDTSTITYLFPRYECPTTLDLSLVWALPLSLATTYGIDFSFFSSGYLDVSVRRVILFITIYSL